jgi:NAD(P)-dependent dehydrogenase (short-subunit alcohol dehydrogenase family)
MTGTYLKGRAVVVTGAGRGLGRAYALHAASEGADVVVNDVDADEAAAVASEITAAGARALAVQGSVSDWESARALIAACEGTFGTIDGLVNNAGVFHAKAPWEETEQSIRRIVEVNVLGSMFCGVHALTAMRARGAGSIVNVTSGAHLGLHEISSYGATKGAATSLTYGWALHASETGVRVNAVSPTALTRMSDPGQWGHTGVIPSNPEPAVIAPVVTFLLGERASAINGQVVRLDGKILSLLSKARFGDDRVAAETWSVDVIADAFETGALGPLMPIGMAHPANSEVEGG